MLRRRQLGWPTAGALVAALLGAALCLGRADEAPSMETPEDAPPPARLVEPREADAPPAPQPPEMAPDDEAAAAVPTSNGGVPTRPPLSRYQAMMDVQPFGDASAELNPGRQAGFAQNLYVEGIGGDDRIYIATKDKTDSFLIAPERPHEGIELVKINWSPDYGQTTVTVRKAGEVATIEFDKAALASATSGTPGAPPANAGPPGIPRAGTPPTAATPNRTNIPNRTRLIRAPRPISSTPNR